MSATCSQPEAGEAGGQLDQEPAREGGEEGAGQGSRCAASDEPPGDRDLICSLPRPQYTLVDARYTVVLKERSQWCPACSGTHCAS